MKKRIIIISTVIILSLVIVGLYNTFATEETTNDNVYDITLTGDNNEINVPAGTSKTVIYKVTNTNKGVVNYGLVYTGENIIVKVYDDSTDKETALIDYGETKFIKLYITNTGTTDSIASIKTVLGYENGGNLNNPKILPTGYTFVEDVHCKKRAFAVYSETDYSLTFYNNNDFIVVGSDYNGKKVTAIYTGFETDNSGSQPGWSEYKRTIESVTVAETISPVNTSYWFYDIYECTNMDLSKLDTSNVISMDAMFGALGYDMETISIKGLDKWDTSKVESMYYMFARVGRDASIWDIGDISNWDVSNVKNMKEMFYYTGTKVKNRVLDLSGWNTSSLINTTRMFGATTLRHIIASDKWNMSKVTDSEGMFQDIDKLIGGLGTRIDASYTDGTYARIDGGSSSPGYFCGPVIMTSDEIRITNTVSGNTYGPVYLEIYDGINWQMIDYLYTGAQYDGTYKHILPSGNYDIRLRLKGSVSDYIIISNNAYFEENSNYSFFWSQSWQDDQNVVLWSFSMVDSYY